MGIWDAVAVAGRLPTAELFAAARQEIEERGDVAAPHLVALHERPTRAVFDQAVRLIGSTDATDRELGVLVLRELGRPDADGRRPFSSDAVPILRGWLRQEADPRVLGWVISALGYNAASEALDEVVGFVDHADARVRFHVAAALPSLVDPDQIEAGAAAALLRLTCDDDAETRYYALYALLEEVAGVDPEQFDRAVAALVDDPDGQIRTMARTRRAGR